MHPVLAQYNKCQQTGASAPEGHQSCCVHLSLEKKLRELTYVHPGEKKVLRDLLIPMRLWRSWKRVCHSCAWYRRMERVGINWNMRVKLAVNKHLPFGGSKAVLDIVLSLSLDIFKTQLDKAVGRPCLLRACSALSRRLRVWPLQAISSNLNYQGIIKCIGKGLSRPSRPTPLQ